MKLKNKNSCSNQGYNKNRPLYTEILFPKKKEEPVKKVIEEEKAPEEIIITVSS